MGGEPVTRPFPAVSEAKTYIAGRWLDGEQKQVLRTPIDGSEATVVWSSSVAEAGEAVEAADEAWRAWRKVPAFERARLLHLLADLVHGRQDDLTTQMVVETGKLARESRAEVGQSVDILHICAEEAKRIAGEGVPMDALAGGAGRLGFTLRVPLGVVVGITPFNVPISAACHKLGPALAAGNTFVLKPHPHGSGVATLFAQLSEEAGIPAGVFNLVQGGPDVGRALVAHPAVRLITFTGSARAAEQIASEAGLKQTLFELGGIGPTIVHRDADLALAVSQTVVAAFALTGQSCASTQRIFVHQDVSSEFTRRFVDAVREVKPGDPFDEASGIGPLVSEEAATRVADWVSEAVTAGAKLLCGGGRQRAYLEPTVLAEPEATSRVVCEEVFGPVVSITAYSRFEDVVALANGTPGGLKAGVFTSSLAVALLAVTELQFGSVNINAPSRFRLAHEPYGGVKQSGWGREGPLYAVRAMTAERMVSFTPVDRPEG
jgi:acyl-CoA reductase-like NAD-dependent aldehyde dehydrogenase